MARALAVNPTVLLVDELSMGLAPKVVEELYAVLAGIARHGLTILVVEQFAARCSRWPTPRAAHQRADHLSRRPGRRRHDQFGLPRR